MVAPDSADSAESPPVKLPPAKLSSTESSPIKLFPTMDLIPVTSKTTRNHAPATLPFQSKVMHSIYELFTDIHEISNVQVIWPSKFDEHNAGWRELGYKRYYHYLRTIDGSGQKNKDHATKKLGDYWLQSPKLLEILNEGDSSEK
ncbi:hypothetical protein K440DRAFT_642594 [Wilcoxina mikolae CBS 423.85]|nr:hypothetical protein K440DRAFT_642594 [Wilcoxina mikolae CBS 423.85]